MLNGIISVCTSAAFYVWAQQFLTRSSLQWNLVKICTNGLFPFRNGVFEIFHHKNPDVMRFLIAYPLTSCHECWSPFPVKLAQGLWCSIWENKALQLSFPMPCVLGCFLPGLTFIRQATNALRAKTPRQLLWSKTKQTLNPLSCGHFTTAVVEAISRCGRNFSPVQ